MIGLPALGFRLAELDPGKRLSGKEILMLTEDISNDIVIDRSDGKISDCRLRKRPSGSVVLSI